MMQRKPAVVTSRFLMAFVVAGTLFARGSVSAEPTFDAPLATETTPMTVTLDERTAPRGFAYTHMTIPVQPGPFTLDYPEWIPGEHGPTGPLNDLSELRISANGQSIAWQRDQVDLYAFHVVVPPGVTSLDVDFTVLINRPNNFVDGNLATREIMVGNWNRYLLYQRNVDNTKYFVTAKLILPPGWSYASALPLAAKNGDEVDFKTVSLETLVDSPTDSGRYALHVPAWTDGKAHAYIDVFADHPEDLVFPPKELAAYECMFPAEVSLYGGRHWDVYHAELTLSDLIPGQGIEHHQSSDDRASDDFITNLDNQLAGGDLVTHELSHSWNGKYRRPFDLQQPDFNDPYPEHTELLWQYEGMNQYMGDLIAFRCGIKGKASDYPEYFASIYAQMASESGRRTTPIIDLTTGAPYYYADAGGDYGTLRRGSGDFYTEGELMWLDVDTILRQLTHGKKSIDDYVKVFAGGTSSPRVVTYTREDLEHYLGEVAPYDWHGFFEKYVYSIAPEPPTDEIARAGYRYVLSDKPNRYLANLEKLGKFVDTFLSAGIIVDKDGKIVELREDSPAWDAGLGVNETIVAIDGRQYTPDAWRAAVKATATSTAPLSLLVDHDGHYEDVTLQYRGGLKYPHLVRIPGTTDMLSDIVKPYVR
jgi:predicted metalloprotease with PDZ domain